MQAGRLQHSALQACSAVTKISWITLPTTSLEGKSEREQFCDGVSGDSGVELKQEVAPCRLVVPAAHGMQRPTPAVSEKKPAAHGEQVAAPDLENVPAGQVAQALQVQYPLLSKIPQVKRWTKGLCRPSIYSPGDARSYLRRRQCSKGCH
jgi:hypothetical protein